MRALPDAQVRVRKGELVCVVTLQPKPACKRYTAEIRYKHRDRPHVRILAPALELHPGAASLPHVYQGDELCLHLPGEWRDELLLARTIFPWTCAWLVHYEVWLVTGHWTGSGHDCPAMQPASG